MTLELTTDNNTDKKDFLSIDQISLGLSFTQSATSNVTDSENLLNINFFNKQLGALICNDIGNKTYDTLFNEALISIGKGSWELSWSQEDKEQLSQIMAEKLSNVTTYSGYKIIDFVSNDSGFQGGIYYNEATEDYVIVCRGTEFKSGQKEFYKDFIQTDILEFGLDKLPTGFYEMEYLVEKALLLANNESSKVHLVGHSLGGGVAALIGALDKYKNIDVTTYNAVGVEHLLDNLAAAGENYVLQNNVKSAANITNYVTCNDFVSPIFNLIGENTYMVSPNNQNHSLQTKVNISIQTGNSVENVQAKAVYDEQYAANGHGIENFISNNSFQAFVPCEEFAAYKTFVSILRLMGGTTITTDVIAPFLGVFLNNEDSIGSKILYKIFKPEQGTVTGGAAPIQGQISITEGAITQDHILNGICNLLVSSLYDIDVVVKAKNSDNPELDTVFLANASDGVSTIESIKNGHTVYDEATDTYNWVSYNYFEAYYNGAELIYDQEKSYDSLVAYLGGNATQESLSALLKTDNNYNLFNYIEIMEHDESGDSTVIISDYADYVDAGMGNDKYIINATKNSFTTILDSDGIGSITKGNITYHGTNNAPIAQGLWVDAMGNRYEWSGTAGDTLTINGNIKVEGFKNHDLGITLNDFPDDTLQKIDPLILDLDGDGIELVSMADSNAYFDLNSDGIREKVQWISPDDGMLVLDKNADGEINGVDELFGNPSTIGFEDLRQYDDNNDGKININDTKFSQIRVWQDANSNGNVDTGELTTLSERNITEISLNYQDGEDDTFAEKSTITYGDGTTGLIQDINLEVNFAHTKYEAPDNVPADISVLPQSLGAGLVKDLHTSMINNSNLKTYVEGLATKTSTEIYNSMDELLKIWTGVANIANTEMRGLCPKYIADIVEKFYNRQYTNTTEETGEVSDEITIDAVNEAFISNYNMFKTNLYTDIVLQSGKLSCLSGIVYNQDTNSYTINTTTTKENITNSIKEYLLTANNVDTAILAQVLDKLSTEYVYSFDVSTLDSNYSDAQKLILSGRYKICFDKRFF